MMLARRRDLASPMLSLDHFHLRSERFKYMYAYVRYYNLWN